MSVPAEEQERLASVIFGARMLAQGLKSRILRAVTELDLMQEDPDLPRKFHDVIRDALTQLNLAAEDTARLEQAVRQILPDSD